jgi:HPt (histidine-containing phosphotransfer) domain-containing protein
MREAAGERETEREKGNRIVSTIASECQELYSTLGADPDLGGIVGMFVDEMPDRIAALREHFGNGDWAELGRIAHQLKGAAGSYGFDQIAPHAARLESCARGGESAETIREAYETLVNVCSRIRAGARAD